MRRFRFGSQCSTRKVPKDSAGKHVGHAAAFVAGGVRLEFVDILSATEGGGFENGNDVKPDPSSSFLSMNSRARCITLSTVQQSLSTIRRAAR
jgi:hypothetical protein